MMVHIHGGGFVGGAATTAWNLSRTTGHVVFSIQYRLGVRFCPSLARVE